MDYKANLGCRRIHLGVRGVSYLPNIYIYIRVRGVKKRTNWSGVIFSGKKGHTSKIGNLSRISNLASEIIASCHIFRDVDVISAFV